MLGRGAPLRDDGEAAIGLGAGLGDDALGDLLLEHQRHAREPGRPGLRLEPADQEPGGDFVGKVGDDANVLAVTAVPTSAGQSPVERVAGMHFETARIVRGDLGQGRQAARVALDGDDAGGAFQDKGAGETAGARPDLDDGCAGEIAGAAGDAARQVEIEDEVLAEALPGVEADACGSPRPGVGGHPRQRHAGRGSRVVVGHVPDAPRGHPGGGLERGDQARWRGASGAGERRRRCRGPARCARTAGRA